MVGADEYGRIGRRPEEAVVGEDEGGTAGNYALRFQDLEVLIESDAAQGDDYTEVGQEIELPFEIGPAVSQLFWRGLVGRRGAVGGGGDVDVMEGEAVIGGNAGRLGGETGLIQGAV